MESEGVGDGHVEQEPKDIAVKLPALTPALVSPQLISPVHTSHVRVVGDDSTRARDRHACAIQLPPLHSAHTVLYIGGHDSDEFLVLPNVAENSSVLPHKVVSPVIKFMLIIARKKEGI